MRHTLINNMVTNIDNTSPGNSTYQAIQQMTQQLTGGNGFFGELLINVHSHGIYGSPGVWSQANVSYSYGDNIFYALPPRPNLATPAQSLTYLNDIANDHMPGMFYMHAHVHGQTALSVGTASALVIVEGDSSFLPDNTGCGPMNQYLSTVPEKVLHMTALNLLLPGPLQNDPAFNTKSIYQLIAEVVATNDTSLFYPFLDFPNLQWMAEANADPLRMNGTNKGADVIIVNGGYLPIVTMPAGGWHRWRIMNAAIQNILSLAFIDPATQLPVNKCEMRMFAKDGQYMMQIPRTVTNLYPGSGNRVEILVRCNGTEGDEFLLASGYGPNPQGVLDGCDQSDPGCDFFKGTDGTLDTIVAYYRLLTINPTTIT